MFSDDSINIHYRAPTSKLLKMNTFNEFELNRIKKFYNDELASRLQRSKSSRLASSRPQAGSSPADWPAHFGEQRRQTQSAERLAPFGLAGRRFVGAPESPDSACVDLNRYQRAFLAKGAQLTRRTVRFGRALFDFQAKSDRELSVRRGDLLELLELIEHTWARVEDCQSGLQGLVPLSYIDYSVGCAVAKRDVCGQQRVARGGVAAGPHEAGAPILAMSKGEPITLIRRLSGHWYEASNTRQAMGLVWSNDLDIIKQPVLIAKPRQSGSPYTDELDCAEEGAFEDQILLLDSGERVLARRRAQSASGARNPETYCAYSRCSSQQVQPCAPTYATCGSQCCRTSKTDHFELPRRSSSSPYIASQSQQANECRPEEPNSRSASSATADELPRLFRAKYTYLPRQKDELRLTPGEILMVVHQCDDGWFIGSSYSTKQMGTFPGNFVEPI